MIYAGHFKLVKDDVIQLVIYSLETDHILTASREKGNQMQKNSKSLPCKKKKAETFKKDLNST